MLTQIYSQKPASATAYTEPKILAYLGKYRTYRENREETLIQPKELSSAPGRLSRKLWCLQGRNMNMVPNSRTCTPTSRK